MAAAGNNDEQAAAVLLLRCADFSRFAVTVSLALQRRTRAADAAGAGQRVLDLPRGVSGSGVATAVAYWVGRDAAAAAHGADLGEFDREFADGLTHDAAVDLIHAAHHLGDDALFDLVSCSISKSLDKSVAARTERSFQHNYLYQFHFA